MEGLMSSIRLSCCLLGLLLVFGTARADEAELRSRIQSIRIESEQVAEQLKGLEIKQKKTEVDLGSARAQLARTREREVTLRGEIENRSARLGAIQGVIEDLEMERSEIDAALMGRIRALYIMESTDLSALFLGMQRGRDFERVSYLVSRIQRSDQELVASLLELTERQSRELQQQKALLAEQEAALGELEQQRIRQEQIQQQVLQLSRELKAQSESIEEQLLSFEAQALRLESVLASLTTEPSPGRSPSESSSRRAARGMLERPVQQEPYQGRGLFRLKGSLRLPVAGEVVSGFGASTRREFSQLVTSRGITFTAKQGADIVAIGEGRVIFQGSMPGMGEVAILDHGERYYSLYGKLNEVSVRVSEEVRAGQSLGRVGESAQLYFEIRKNGAPVNPQSYYHRPFAAAQ